jgi:rhodanese-related sulfurtransferase
MTATPIDAVLTTARARLNRLTPRNAFAGARVGALLVDIRPQINRSIEGEIPGALIIDRNVLEWRLDPASDARIPQASYDAWIVLFCNEGYASSLAAVSLQDLGIAAATDMIGGYRAWRSLDLPTTAGISDEARVARIA